MAIGDILTPALGVALSPFPIVAVILMLSSAQARRKGIAFAVGWMTGLAVLVGVLLVAYEWVGIDGDDTGPSTLASVIRLALGIGLVLLALSKWRSRPKPGETAAMPGWMASIERSSPLTAIGWGAVMSGVNPKNLLFNLMAATAIASSGASVPEEIVAWLVYLLLASSTVIVPVVWYLVAPVSAAARLDEPRRWLIQNSGVLMGVIILVIGVSQIGDAISALGA